MTKLVGLMLLPFAGYAHDVITTKLTWTQEISRIVYKHCASCHRDGGAAPMPLITYDEARPWAKAIREEVAERRMPPWGAVKGFGEFRNDASLSAPEIEMLILWVEGGAPKGDDVYLPRIAEPETPKPAPAVRGVTVLGETTLVRGITATGIAPRAMQPNTAMQIIARLPDGSVKNLMWLRNTRTEWKRSFIFREALALPKGTLIAVRPRAAAVILTGKPEQ